MWEMYLLFLYIDWSIDNFLYVFWNIWLGLLDFFCLFFFDKDKIGLILIWEKLILIIKNNNKKNFLDVNCCNWRVSLWIFIFF